MPSKVKKPRLYAPGEERALAMAIRRDWRGRAAVLAGSDQTELFLLLGAVRSALSRWHNPEHSRDGICMALGSWYADWVWREIAERSTLARRYVGGVFHGRLYVYWGGVDSNRHDGVSYAEACRLNREAILRQTERTIVHLLRMQGLRHAELEL